MTGDFVRKVGIGNPTDPTYQERNIAVDSDHVEVIGYTAGTSAEDSLSKKIHDLENAVPDVATASTAGIVKPGSGLKMRDGVTDGTMDLAYDHTLTLKDPSGATLETYNGSTDKNVTVSTVPTNHSSSNTTYGLGDSLKYGHVKLTDSYKTAPAAPAGTAASAQAIYTMYSELTSTPNGHTVINSSGLPMTDRPNLQFDGFNVEDVENPLDPNENKTVVHGQLKICATKAEWDALSQAEKDDPNTYWVRPWADTVAFATDKTPVGTVLSVATAKDGEVTDPVVIHTPSGAFPTDDYLVCNGQSVLLNKYPALAKHFEDNFGSVYYFTAPSYNPGYFSLPNWSSDFPSNGVLVMKARESSNAITFAEIDDASVSEDKIWSSEKIDGEIDALKEVLSGKYIIVNPHKTIYSSSSSGVATTLMKQVADNLLTYTQALSNDEIFILKGLSLPSISYFGVLSTGLYKLTNADTTASYWFSQMTCSSSSTYIYNACVSSTSSINIVTRTDLSSSGTVINNMSSNSLMGTAVIYGILLRKITQ